MKPGITQNRTETEISKIWFCATKVPPFDEGEGWENKGRTVKKSNMQTEERGYFE